MFSSLAHGSWMLRQRSVRLGQSTGAWAVYPWTTASPHLPMALSHAVVPGEAIWPAGCLFTICTKCSKRTQRSAGLGRAIMLLLAHNNMQLSGDWRTRQAHSACSRRTATRVIFAPIDDGRKATVARKLEAIKARIRVNCTSPTHLTAAGDEGSIISAHMIKVFLR